MKIVISHGHTKREIKGSFSLCGTGEDLASIAHQILRRVEDDGVVRFNYGWVDIHADAPPTLGGVAPVGWDDPGEHGEGEGR